MPMPDNPNDPVANDGENRLHDLVRNAARQQQPSYEEAHWEAMQKKLRVRPRHGHRLAALPVLLLLAWLTADENKAVSKISNPVYGRQFSKSGSAFSGSAGWLLSKNVAGKTEKRQLGGEKIVSAQTAKPTRMPSGWQDGFFFPDKHFIAMASPRPMEPWPPDSVVPGVKLNMNAWIEQDIRQRLEHRTAGPDSAASRTLERNKNRWRNVAIVADFTSSMYPHAAELFTWLAQNRRNQYIKGAVFFTDCDSLGRETQPGNPGKMYLVRDWRNTDILPVFIDASRNTMGNAGAAENDLEAVLYAQRQFANAESLVLVADNGSPVKDMHLLPQVTKPVRIVLCGNTHDPKVAIQPDYLKIAAATKGSIHTPTTDLPDVTRMARGGKIRIGKHWYRYRRGRFVLRR